MCPGPLFLSSKTHGTTTHAPSGEGWGRRWCFKVCYNRRNHPSNRADGLPLLETSRHLPMGRDLYIPTHRKEPVLIVLFLESSADKNSVSNSISPACCLDFRRIKHGRAHDLRDRGQGSHRLRQRRLELPVFVLFFLLTNEITGTSDPYVKLSLGHNHAQTKRVDKTLTPKWNETFYL